MTGQQRPAIGTQRDALRAVALGMVRHTLAGACPDQDNGWLSRDPQCPACAVLLREGDEVAWQQWGVVLDEAGSADLYDTESEARAAHTRHGGDLVQVTAVHVAPDATTPPGRPSATQALAALRDRASLRRAATAAYAQSREIAVKDLDDGDSVWFDGVENAIVTAIATGE